METCCEECIGQQRALSLWTDGNGMEFQHFQLEGTYELESISKAQELRCTMVFDSKQKCILVAV